MSRPFFLRLWCYNHMMATAKRSDIQEDLATKERMFGTSPDAEIYWPAEPIRVKGVLILAFAVGLIMVKPYSTIEHLPHPTSRI
ncbi:hypothetical protein F4801DRAFT_585212 [Xylaria longipes]|nr:hypothetical protein F4801DRAFT_585212 [Xylaria longipes]